jgi:hypothetical protein
MKLLYLEDDGTTIIQNVGYYYQSTWRNIPEDMNLLYLFFYTSGK